MSYEAYKEHYGKICRDIVRKRSLEMTFMQMEKMYGVSRGTLRRIDIGNRVSIGTIRRILLQEGIEMEEIEDES